MGLKRASLILCMAFVVVAAYSLMEVSGSRVGAGHANNNSSQPGSWGWGWGWGWGGPGFNRSGAGGAGGGCPTTQGNRTHGGPKKIIVGGSQQMWNFGFNYSDWAMKTAPFYLNDVLVFKYDPPSNGSHPHSVYLLPDGKSYQNCDLRRAKRLASPTQGSGKGFKYQLKKWQPYYFACGESNGFHCSVGMMKFFVVPVFHSSR